MSPTACSRLSRTAPVVAGFGFEGSFDFEDVLHPQIAHQVDAIAAGEAVRLALVEADSSSANWRELLARLRDES